MIFRVRTPTWLLVVALTCTADVTIGCGGGNGAGGGDAGVDVGTVMPGGPDGSVGGTSVDSAAAGVADAAPAQGRQLPVGSACEASSDCANGQCVDRVCCAVAACGTCAACESGTGECKLVSRGEPDVGSCEGGRACDGAGSCKQAAGVECVDDAQCSTGFCIDNVCCKSACKEACATCGGDLKGECRPLFQGEDLNATETCRGDFACFDDPTNAGQAVCRKPDGKACGAAAQCLSGACTAFHVDADGDSYGADDKAQKSFCGLQPPAGFSARAGDCNDGQPSVRPNQTEYFSSPIPGTQGYDYNCNKQQELEFPNPTYWQTDGFEPSNGLPGCGQSHLRKWTRECSRGDCTPQCSVPAAICNFSCSGCSAYPGCDDQECNIGCESSGVCWFSPLNELVFQRCR